MQQSEASTRYYGVWFLIRLTLLVGCAVGLICAYVTGSIVPCIVTSACAMAAALLDAWALRVRSRAEPLDGGVRALTALDTWQPVAAFAALALIGINADGADVVTRVLLVGFSVAAFVVIFVSRRAYV